MMKKIIMAALLSICLVSLFAAGSKEDSLTTIKQRGTLIIATEGNWTPWTYHDASDTLTGFDVQKKILFYIIIHFLAFKKKENLQVNC